jgi:uncharacterized membrane protein YqhA
MFQLLVYAVLVALALFVVGMMSIVYKLVRALKEEEEEIEQQTIPKPADQVIAHTRPNAEVVSSFGL